MINSRIQIEDGAIEDFYTKWGFIYLSGDHRFAPPEKKRDTTSYVEEAGEHTDPRTVDDAFDYSAKFLIETPNSKNINANSKIKAWHDAVRVRTKGSDIKCCKTVTFYDDYKRVRVVGIPEIIEEVEDTNYYRRIGWDCIVFTLKIHVSNPNFCDFDTEEPPEIQLQLTTDGTEIKAQTNRALANNEEIRLLSCGAGRVHQKLMRPKHMKSRNRWHVNQEDGSSGLQARCVSFGIMPDGTVDFYHGPTQGRTTEICLIGKIGFPHGDIIENFKVWKSNASVMWFPLEVGKGGKVCYGFAIYRERKRISNVAYFRLNFKVKTVSDSPDSDDIERWVTI